MANEIEKWRELPARGGADATDMALGKQRRTRRRLLGFALELFARQGYQNTTAAEIAAAAGVSRATFFLHFPTKAALVGELSRELAELWEAEPAPQGERAVEAIRRFLVFLFREAGDETVGSASVGALALDFFATYGTDMSAGIGAGTLHDRITALITRAQAEGDWSTTWSATTLGHILLISYNLVRPDLKDRTPEGAADALVALLTFGAQEPVALP
ncbi:TetR/AcrR family transcriptional regulator [Sphingomonas sp. NPDC092331]|uniref:TetR/AcrR family transcriptional regulator n=1 Tax=unclassified Sphingomonas TaxID=196159 RepID=UPI0031F4A6D0